MGKESTVATKQRDEVPAPAARLLKHSALEGLLRGFGVAQGSEDMAHVVRLCGGSDNFLPSEVPVEAYVATLEWLAHRFFPNRPRSESLFLTGAKLFEGYRQTLLGQIQLAALNMIGPARLMKKAPDFIGRNSNFGERTTEQLGPRHFWIHFRGVPVPGDYYHGLLHAGLMAAGVKAPRTRWMQVGPEDMDFEAMWD